MYWTSQVTGTQTGESIEFTTPHSSNTRVLLRDIGLDWEEIYKAQEMLMIRDFQRHAKRLTLHNSCVDDAIKDKIKEIIG